MVMCLRPLLNHPDTTVVLEVGDGTSATSDTLRQELILDQQQRAMALKTKTQRRWTLSLNCRRL